MKEFKLLIDRNRAEELKTGFSLNIREPEPDTFIIDELELDFFRTTWSWIFLPVEEIEERAETDQERAEQIQAGQSVSRSELTTQEISHLTGLDDAGIRELCARFNDCPFQEINGEWRVEHNALKRWVSNHKDVLSISTLHFRTDGRVK